MFEWLSNLADGIHSLMDRQISRVSAWWNGPVDSTYRLISAAMGLWAGVWIGGLFVSQGVEALSTILIMFAIASIVVGAVFWTLGQYHLGRVIYFFPTVSND